MNDADRAKARSSIAFLLAQIGAFAAGEFAKALAPLGITPADAGILRLLNLSPGISQQDLARKLHAYASRLVMLIDELENKGFVVRETNSSDRRTYSLRVTNAGSEKLKEIGQVARRHNATICDGLNDKEQTQLKNLLERIAAQKHLQPMVHPGYESLPRKTTPKPTSR